MPRLSDSQELLHHGLEQAGEFGGGVKKRAKNILGSFSDFAVQDNVLEVAFGLIIAAGFTTVVTSFVSEILLPPLSLLPFINRNMDAKFAVLQAGPTYNTTDGIGYNTLKEAAEDGAVVMAYGVFINRLVSFLGVGLALYMLASFYDWMSEDHIIKRTIKCRYCRKRINTKAKRCVNCTSWQDGREDMVTREAPVLDH